MMYAHIASKMRMVIATMIRTNFAIVRYLSRTKHEAAGSFQGTTMLDICVANSSSRKVKLTALAVPAEAAAPHHSPFPRVN